ncbi:MAG: Gfo/Idh/MocA family protein [Candidatus Latescibacterota bacterium]
MSEKRLKIAIIGAGMIANAGHIPAWKNLADDVEIAAIYNRSITRAQETAARHDIPHAYDDCAQMLSEIEPDIAAICTPNVSHKDYALAALDAGAHVFCEKPVAACYADAVEMFARAEEKGRILFITQTGRFSNRTIAAKEIADSGQLGEMYYAETSALRRRGVPTWGRFHLKGDSGGGPLCDIGVHALDALLWIMGNPKVIAASGATYTKIANQDEGLVESLADSGAPIGVFAPRPYDFKEYDVEDMAAGFLRLENGATISLKVSWAANVPEGMGGTMVLGTKGGLRLDPLTFIGTLGRYQADSKPQVPSDPDIPFYGHWKAAAHLVNVLRGKEELLITKEEVLNVMGALDGLYRSAEQSGEVRL